MSDLTLIQVFRSRMRAKGEVSFESMYDYISFRQKQFFPKTLLQVSCFKDVKTYQAYATTLILQVPAKIPRRTARS